MLIQTSELLFHHVVGSYVLPSKSSHMPRATLNAKPEAIPYIEYSKSSKFLANYIADPGSKARTRWLLCALCEVQGLRFRSLRYVLGK